MTLDYEASAARLSRWLAERRTSESSPTEYVKELRALAKQLEATAAQMSDLQSRGLELEQAIDKDLPPQIRIDGLPISTDETNAGRYQHAITELREIATTSNRLADEQPNARAKPELLLAATYFLHIWYEAGNALPTLYDNSEAVTAFKGVLDAGNYPLSKERARGILTTALETFDPLFHPPGFAINKFLVWRQ